MIHFISGFPRSGSTLLAALLRQNPDFHAGIISPLGPITRSLQDSFCAGSETQAMVDEAARLRIFRATFDAYYEDKKPRVIFDTNRRWCAVAPLLKQLYPESRIICCVRPQVEVINSFEVLFRQHPTYTSRIIDLDTTGTIYQRVQALMGGVAGFAFDAFAEAYHSCRDRLFVMDYKALASTPHDALDSLHWILGLRPFDYDIDHVENIPGVREFDLNLGAPGLHEVRPRVDYQEAKIILPPDVVAKLPVPFWR